MKFQLKLREYTYTLSIFIRDFIRSTTLLGRDSTSQRNLKRSNQMMDYSTVRLVQALVSGNALEMEELVYLLQPLFLLDQLLSP